MTTEPRGLKVATQRVQLPPMTFEDTFQWDGVGPLSRDGGPKRRSTHTLPRLHDTRVLTETPPEMPCQTAMGWHAGPSLTRSDRSPVHASAPQAIDWAREAAGLTVALDQRLFLTAARDAIPGVTGELVWVDRGRQAPCLTLYVHPVLLIHGAFAWHHPKRVAMVLHLHAGDPLLHHMTLVLHAAIDAEGVPGRLYAEALTDALAVHLLLRYAACRPPAGAGPAGLSKPTLRRTTDYIAAHLAHECSVAELAAVAQTSPDHFARLFRHATGHTPHQYVILCRIARAKQLLTETASPIVEIGHQVGFTDQSYFTAVFRKHVATTPSAYRADTQPS